LALPAAALARPGFVSANLNLHAGPSVNFPVIDTIPDASRVNIHGCLSGYTWCDVSWRGERGWADGEYLQFVYRGRRVLIVNYGDEIGFPIVGFNIGTYWGHHYRHRSFYGRIGYWRHHYHGHRHGHVRHGGHVGVGAHPHGRRHGHRAAPMMGHRANHARFGAGPATRGGARAHHGRGIPHFRHGAVGRHQAGGRHGATGIRAPHAHRAPHFGAMGGHAMPHPHGGGHSFGGGHVGHAPHLGGHPGGGHPGGGRGGHPGGGHPGGHPGHHHP
jgi:uncharacterized protein YraI